jgi:hypothetical protein
MLRQAPCPAGLGTEAAPFHTLLQNDDRVTRVDVDTARLLGDWESREALACGDAVARRC